MSSSKFLVAKGDFRPAVTCRCVHQVCCAVIVHQYIKITATAECSVDLVHKNKRAFECDDVTRCVGTSAEAGGSRLLHREVAAGLLSLPRGRSNPPSVLEQVLGREGVSDRVVRLAVWGGRRAHSIVGAATVQVDPEDEQLCHLVVHNVHPEVCASWPSKRDDGIRRARTSAESERGRLPAPRGHAGLLPPLLEGRA